MLDHLGIDVSNFENSKTFYQTALAPLGYKAIREVDTWAGRGAKGKPDFWIHAGKPTTPRLQVAFRCDDRASVQAFYQAALKAGAKDNGAPGVRATYHPHYYGTFVIDPDGHNIETVCHHPE